MQKIIVITSTLVPGILFAQGVQNLVQTVLGWIDSLTVIAFALGILFFFYGMAVFVLNVGSTDGQEKGRNLMIWGVVAVFVMASVWGLVQFLQSSFDLDSNNQPISQPTIQFR